MPHTHHNPHHPHHNPHLHLVPMPIEGYHQAECYPDHCHVMGYVPPHTGYVNVHEHDHGSHAPHQPSPHGYHWVYIRGHYEDPSGHQYTPGEWGLHHDH